MNAAFEDALVFDEILEREGLDLSKAAICFAKERREDGDAIAKLSYNNYKEMSSHTSSTLFLWRKKFEGILHSIFPTSWIPLYTMGAFTRIPYSEVIRRSDRQDRILERITSTVVASVVAAVGIGGYTYWRSRKQ